MLNKLFGDNSSKTGFYKVTNGKLDEIPTMPGNGSINDCIESLGFPLNHIHTILTFDSDKITCLGFKTLSRELIFVLAKNRKAVNYQEVLNEIGKIDWDFEYSSLNVEDILEEGIEKENFYLDFLKSTIDLTPEGRAIYRSEKFGLYFQFENDLLKAFSTSDWDNTATKWLRNLNPTMVRNMEREALHHHQNEIDSVEEVNGQANSLLEIPNVVNNEYIPLHTKSNGNINFYNLLIAHYGKQCNIKEFMFMNKGRLEMKSENIIEVDKFSYYFGPTGQIEQIQS